MTLGRQEQTGGGRAAEEQEGRGGQQSLVFQLDVCHPESCRGQRGQRIGANASYR